MCVCHTHRLLLAPSMMYVASVHGDPTKPSTAAWLPTSVLSWPSALPTNSSLLRSRGVNCLTCTQSKRDTSRCHQQQPGLQDCRLWISPGTLPTTAHANMGPCSQQALLTHELEADCGTDEPEPAAQALAETR